MHTVSALQQIGQSMTEMRDTCVTATMRAGSNHRLYWRFAASSSPVKHRVFCNAANCSRV